MKSYEAIKIAELLTTVATQPVFARMGDEGIRCVARAIVDAELRDIGVPYTENVFSARNALIRETMRLVNIHDGSCESAKCIKDHMEGYAIGAFETAGVMEW